MKRISAEVVAAIFDKAADDMVTTGGGVVKRRRHSTNTSYRSTLRPQKALGLTVTPTARSADEVIESMH
jgi:hypothetical protein